LRIGLGHRSAIRLIANDTDSFSNRHKFSQGPNLHFLHDLLAVGLDGAFGRTQDAADLLIGLTGNDEFKYLPLPRR